MEQRPAISIDDYPRLGTGRLRKAFVVAGLFRAGRVTLCHWETDRTVIGGAVPGRKPLELPVPRELAASAFNERRELGIVNLGGPGAVTVGGRRYALGPLDSLYVGRGARRVVFASDSARQPARFYLLSYPAHARYPTRRLRRVEVPVRELGGPGQKNHRLLHQLIHPDGIRSCQLVMGFTLVQPGSKWNTMPPHTHQRRSEVYLYFGLPRGASVKHFLGAPGHIRHLRLRNGEAVLSPPWSIHCGAGTAHYGFVWGMGGENQDWADMDPVDPGLIH